MSGTEGDGVQPTARPWHRGYGRSAHPYIVGEGRAVVAEAMSEADAEHIVTCVNLHAELVEALRECEVVISADQSWEGCQEIAARARAVLAKVQP